METSADLSEDAVFVPREPGPEVQRYWLPSTRAAAIEWARWARLPCFTGLAVDDATLERVADAVMDPANPPPWQPYTAEERRDDLPANLWDDIQGYLADHPEAESHVDIRWRDGRRTFVVGVDDPDPHRAALARIAGSRVVVEHRARRRWLTYAEGEAICDRLEADRQEFAEAGLSVEHADWAVDRVEVHVAGGSDERTVAELFAARYGDEVDATWLGPHRFWRPIRPFGSWTSAGRFVRVFYAVDPNGERPGEARVAEETDERIVIALRGRDAARAFRTAIGGFTRHHADVELREPVGDRIVIDASAGVARPALAELAVPTGRAPRLHVIQVEAASAASRRPAQVWFSGTDDDAVYEAMLPVDDPLDEDGDPVVMPAVRRDVLETIARDLEESPGNAKHVGIRVSWAGDVLVVSRTADDGGDPVDAFMPGPDGLYEVGRLAGVVGLSPWYEVEPPLPHGPIDAGMALDLLSRATRRHPTRDLILKRLDIDVLRTARARAPSDAIRDALDEEIAGRTHGQNVKLFLVFLHRLKRETPEGRAWDAGYLGDFVELEGREAILRAVPDAVERVVAVLRDERDPEARARLTAALARLGLDVADDDGPA